MQRSPTAECKGEVFSFPFFFLNTAVQQAVEWLFFFQEYFDPELLWL